MVAWLATFYQSHGWSAAASGSLVALLSVAQAAMALLLPVLAARQRERRPWLWLSLALQGVGFAALALWPDLAPRTGLVQLGCVALVAVLTVRLAPQHCAKVTDAPKPS